MTDYLAEAVHGERGESEEIPGAITNHVLLPAMQYTDSKGNVEDDPDAEWEIISIQGTSTELGTIKVTSVDPTSSVLASEDIAGPFEVLADTPFGPIEIKKKIGKKRDLAVTTTGTGTWRIVHKTRAHHYSNARVALEYP
jgi:hypothetical protein